MTPLIAWVMISAALSIVAYVALRHDQDGTPTEVQGVGVALAVFLLLVGLGYFVGLAIGALS